MAVTHTSSFYDTTPGKGVDEIQWSKGLPSIGASEYGVKGAGDWKVTGVGGAPFTLAIAKGMGWCHGVADTTALQDTLTVPALTSGTRWDFIVNRYDWKPTGGGPTAFAVISNSGKQIPASRKNLPGDEVDQPLALVEWKAGQTQPQTIIDLRCWAGNGGVVAVDALAKKYLARPGACVSIAGVTMSYELQGNGVWEWSDGTMDAALLKGKVAPGILPAATTAAAGALSAADKKKLDVSPTTSYVASAVAAALASAKTYAAAQASAALASARTYALSVAGTAGSNAEAYARNLTSDMRPNAGGIRGVGSISNGGSAVNLSVTFPSGRFSVAPKLGISVTSSRINIGIQSVSSTGFVFTASNYSGQASDSFDLMWTAVQN